MCTYNLVLFDTGINGLQELQLIDPVFVKFENNLFHDSSITLERMVQAKDVNEQLNRNISEFLTRLSPYFLLKPAHKTLEWLIHRYSMLPILLLLL